MGTPLDYTEPLEYGQLEVLIIVLDGHSAMFLDWTSNTFQRYLVTDIKIVKLIIYSVYFLNLNYKLPFNLYSSAFKVEELIYFVLC